MNDDPEIIKNKLKKAVTATAGGDEIPGVTNLFLLLKEFSKPAVYKKFTAQENDGNIKYAELKEQLAEDIADHFADFRKKRVELKKNPEKVNKILEEGAKKAKKVASQTLKEVKQKMGLI